MTDYSHIHPDYRFIMAGTDADRIAFLKVHRWIGHRYALAVIRALEDLMNEPKRAKMPCMLLVGDSDAGKTTVVNRFRDLHGTAYVDDDDQPVKPVIVADAPPVADAKALVISILESFYAPFRASDSLITLTYQVVHMCRLCRCQILFIDEFHSMLTGTPVHQRTVMNTIKLLCNQLQIPIVGVGTPEAVQMLRFDRQHETRFSPLELPLWQANTDFQQMLALVESAFPLKKPSGLSTKEMAGVLLAYTGGNNGTLLKLLKEAGRKAIETGAERIDRELIVKVATAPKGKLQTA